MTVRKIADSILYEGYLLYPYRKSALKNQKRFNFGVLEPNEQFRAEILCRGNADKTTATLRFLQILRRQVFDEYGNAVDSINIDGETFESWDEVVERSVEFSLSSEFSFTAERSVEELKSGAKFVRESGEIKGCIEVSYESAENDLTKISFEICNLSSADQFLSTHVIVENADGFVSMLEFDEKERAAVESLKQDGLFPVLAGEKTMLLSPIIIYDLPKIAPESDGDLFDATEIDELLSLRILTLTDDEKQQIRTLDARGKALLERTENADLMELHGTWRGFSTGERVRLNPKKGADAFDMFLAGKTGKIDKIETDLEGKTHYAVVLDGEEIIDERKPVAKRFFFAADELERV